MKQFAKLVLSLLVISIIAFPIHTNNQLNAQEESRRGLFVSPAFVEIEAGDSYTVIVKNDTAKTIESQVRPSLYQIDPEQRVLLPVEPGTISTVDIKKHIKFTPEKISLKSNESIEIKVELLKSVDDYFVGIKISTGEQESVNVSAQGFVHSMIIDKNIGQISEIEADDLIAQELTVKPKFGFNLFGRVISLDTQYDINSSLQNGSNYIIKPSGEITIVSSDTRLTGIPLTAQLANSLYPNEIRMVDKEYTDDRNIIDRIGKIEFNQRISMSGHELKNNVTIYSVPYQLILFVIIVALLTIVIAYVIGINRSKIKNKEKAQ